MAEAGSGKTRVIERQGFGRPQISPLAQDQNTHRRLTLISERSTRRLRRSPRYSSKRTNRKGRTAVYVAFVWHNIDSMDFSPAFRESLFLVVVSAVGGGVITLLASALLTKSASFRYSTKTERVGVSADDPVFGAVRVQWRNTDVRNLYLVTMEVENVSAKDFENVALTIYTGNDTMLLGEQTEIVGTPDLVRWSPEFQAQLAVPQGGAPTPEQWQTYNIRREYLVPVLNRGWA